MHFGVGNWPIEKKGHAGRRSNQVEQEMNGAGLAGAIRTQKTKNLALPDLEVEHLDGGGFGIAPSRPIDLAQILRANGRHGGHSLTTRSTCLRISSSLGAPTDIHCTTPFLSTSTDVGMPRTP